MNRSIFMGLATAFIGLASTQVFADEASEKQALSAKTAPAFEVRDIPQPEPIEGQLGGPGAPSLKEQQDHLAKSLLEKGICNASYFGEEFCAKHQQKNFKVTDQFGSNVPAPAKGTSQE